MRRKDWLVGAASASGLVAAQRADAAMIGARRSLLTQNIGKELAAPIVPNLWNTQLGYGAFNFSAGTGYGGSNSFSQASNSSSNYNLVTSPNITFVFGATYIVSCYVNGSSVTAGNLLYGIFILNGYYGTVVMSLPGVAAVAPTGASGFQSFTFVFTGAVNAYYGVGFSTNGCTASSPFYLSAPSVKRVA